MALTKMGSTAAIPRALIVLCVVLLVGYISLIVLDGTSKDRAQSGVRWNQEALVSGRSGWLKRPGEKKLLSLEGNKNNLPILAFFSVPDCPYCILMQRTVFANQSIYKLINDNFYPVIVDCSSKDNLTRGSLDDRSFDDRYHSMMVPRLVVAMSDGCPLWSFTGMRSCTKTYAFLKIAIKTIHTAKEKAERMDKEAERAENNKKDAKTTKEVTPIDRNEH